MEMQALRTFQAVVEEGGIISASRKLNTVQSNVTSRIKRLEDELGAKLFHRKGRGLELAPPGKVLLSYARQLIQLERQAEAAVREAGENTGEMRIGSMETYAAFRLPQVLKEVRSTHGSLTLHVETDTSAALIEAVLNLKLDCAFAAGPIDHPDLAVKEIQRERLVLAKQKDASALPDALILFRQGCAYRERALAWQRERGNQLAEIMELGTLDGILGCVAMGLGCTLVPEWVVRNHIYAPQLTTESVPAHIGEVTTLLIRHRSTPPLKAYLTLENAASSSV